MPQIFRIGSYTVYFWSNEGEPLEPIHVHIAEGRASSAGTKIWITSSGKTVLANNNANIPAKVLRGNSTDIMQKWIEFFGEIQYYC